MHQPFSRRRTSQRRCHEIQHKISWKLLGIFMTRARCTTESVPQKSKHGRRSSRRRSGKPQPHENAAQVGSEPISDMMRNIQKDHVPHHDAAAVLARSTRGGPRGSRDVGRHLASKSPHGWEIPSRLAASQKRISASAPSSQKFGINSVARRCSHCQRCPNETQMCTEHLPQ